MSTHIKLYAIDPDTKVLYLCRFSPSLDLNTAFAKGWMRKKSMIKRVGKVAVSLAFVMPTPVLREASSAAAILTKEALDEFHKISEIQSTS